MTKIRLGGALASVVLLAACVTENPRAKTGLYRRTDAPVSGFAPGRPLNRPVDPSSTFQSRVTFAVEPIGSVPFDGMVLPLISTDGRYMAVQEGTPSTWGALVGEPGVTVPTATRLVIYAIPPRDGSARASGLRRLDGPSSLLPAGLLLGRSADATGFLVESPRPDGARWIGRVEFETGELRWLVHNDAVNSHAAFGPGPTPSLVYCAQDGLSPRHVRLRRDVFDPDTEVVVSVTDESLAYPAITPDGSMLSVASLSSGGVWLRAFSLTELDDDARPSSIGKWFISSSATLLSAYQAIVAAPPPGEAPPVATGSSSLMWYLADRQRGMVGIDPATGRTVSAGASTYAVEWAGSSENGGATYLCAQPDGLWFRVLSPAADAPRIGPASSSTGVQALPGEFVPRRTSDPNRPFILFGSSDHGSPTHLRVLGFMPVAE